MNDVQARVIRAAARYLGAHQKSPEFAIAARQEQLMAEAYAEMLSFAAPNHTLRRASVRIERRHECGKEASPTPLLYFGDMPPIAGYDLCRLFAGCTEGFALLATLGMDLDLKIRRLMITNPALSVAVGACGSAYIDAYINDVLARETDLFLTPRFSPGYGDAPLSAQPDLLRFLGAPKLGVHLTQGFLMVPEKSVSALMGITHEKANACLRHCACCAKTDCAFREVLQTSPIRVQHSLG